MTTPAKGFTLEDVLREERDFLRGPTGKDAPPKTQDEPPRPDEFLGLAFSGGGIRSATFNLGVLQALSELKLLKEFDYLSTVSGGGYIGSWLSAWIHRAGIDTVEQQLSMKDHPHEEPKEVTFLRSYSNYLTPRTGIFSTDTLAAVATYLRNLILNLSIVLLCLTVALLLPRMIAWARAAPSGPAGCAARVRRAGARGRRALHQSQSRQPASVQSDQSRQDVSGLEVEGATVRHPHCGGRLDRAPPDARGSGPELLAGRSRALVEAGIARDRLAHAAPRCLDRRRHDLHDRFLLVLRAEDRARAGGSRAIARRGDGGWARS